MTLSKERWHLSPARAAASAAPSPACSPIRASSSALPHARATTSASPVPSPGRRTSAIAPRWPALADETVARHGGLDIVVANAGVGAYGPFVELDPALSDEMMDVNANGTIITAAATVPHLISRGGGDFVSVASEAGRRGLPFEAVYCASKFAQVGFTRALDHELRPHGIRCTNVCPGGVATDFAMEEGRGRTPDMPELAGMMSADDVAEAVLFVLTRPRGHRILEVAFRPTTETSWG